MKPATTPRSLRRLRILVVDDEQGILESLGILLRNAGFNTHTIALSVPIPQLTRNGQMPTVLFDPNAVIGIWSTTWRLQNRTLSATGATPQETGQWVQVSRLGMPLVNEVVIGLKDKDKFNHSKPSADAQFADYVTNPTLPALIEVRGNDLTHLLHDAGGVGWPGDGHVPPDCVRGSAQDHDATGARF